jgi:hypothetical protein
VGADRGLVRPYVVTDGRFEPTRNTFDLVTLVTAVPDRPVRGLGPEQRRMVDLCAHGALSLAEVSAYLALPLSVAKVLLGDLVDSGHLLTRAPVPPAQLPTSRLLQEVLDGLRARL